MFPFFYLSTFDQKKCVLSVFIQKYGDYTHDLTAK